LVELAKVRASPNKWISLMTYTAGIKRFALNCLYSLVKYGNQPHYIVATFDKDSLSSCMELNLACFNATDLSRVKIEGGAFNFGAKESVAMWWAKQEISLLLLRMGYIVHGTDADVVYFRDVRASYGNVLEKTWADGMFLTEESGPNKEDDERSYINMINAGVYALKPSNRTFHFMKHWIGGWERDMDQVYLNKIMSTSYMFCDSRATCSTLKRHRKAAFYRHPHLWKGTSCILPLGDTPCEDKRLFIHYLCGVGWANKKQAWELYNMWVIDDEGRPMWDDGKETKGVNGTKHAFLPCPGIAWPHVSWSPNRRRGLLATLGQSALSRALGFSSGVMSSEKERDYVMQEAGDVSTPSRGEQRSRRMPLL